MEDFEKLGAFYLGRPYDVSAKKPQEGLLLYDSKDLVTHAVCVGMTGSGKTGLCIVLIEEALIDGVPAIVIDPKGDLGNLLLAFPDLAPESFRPWVSEDEARKSGVSVEELAAREAERWKAGLAEWGQSADRIKRLRDAAEIALYTPGSTAGSPVNILESFGAPPQEMRDDSDLFQERIATTATSVLGLVGLAVDPLKSREHILVAKILEALWSAGKDASLSVLIQHVHKPPFDRVGALGLNDFYPEKDRFELATTLNNLLAAPGFDAWLSGDPLDVGGLLRSSSGKPRCAIFSIAHLNDSERMFFVSLLLNQVLAWTRSQPGTTSLRALLYMDEIFGFFPPVANPPSKEPLLRLLKQARAYGVGLVLATQNPVDLDYKGLANTGTWMIGRLQTERDKARVMDGLEGVSATAGGTFDRQAMEQLIAGLGKRVFLLHNVHDEAPVTFESRWALSYLCGPLTRAQIKQLKTSTGADTGTKETPATPPAPPAAPAVPDSSVGATRGGAPVLPDIVQHFVPAQAALAAKELQPGAAILYHPMVLGAANLHFVDARKGVDVTRAVMAMTPITTEAVPVNWARATLADLSVGALEPSPQDGARFADLPPAAGKARSYPTWSKAFAKWLSSSQTIELFEHPQTRQVSKPGESERDFRARIDHAGREARDELVEKLREKYGAKQASLEERLRRAEQRLGKEQQDVTQSGVQTAISVGATILGAVLGRRRVGVGTLGRAATAARGAGRVQRERDDAERASENVETVRQQIADLEARLKADLAKLDASAHATNELQKIALRPRKANIDVTLVALAWVPRSVA
ncbi:MAG: helicase HerA domain-containing protein [Vicinamibacteraceae bacterium]